MLVLEEEEDVYWGLVVMVERLFPRYFEQMVMGSMVDQVWCIHKCTQR